MDDRSLRPATSRGLCDAAARLRSDGYNELPRANRRTPVRIVSEVLREPMLALLLGAGAVYLTLGDLHEALILLAFAMASIVITVVQEARTERVLQALRDLASPRALAFFFGPLHADDLSVTLGAGVVVLVALEALKPLLRERVR